jgi:hypothetical protein
VAAVADGVEDPFHLVGLLVAAHLAEAGGPFGQLDWLEAGHGRLPATNTARNTSSPAKTMSSSTTSITDNRGYRD